MKYSKLILILLLNFSIGNFIPSVYGLDVMGDIGCGQLDQRACTITSIEFWEMGACDEGLEPEVDWKKLKTFCKMGKRKSADIPSWLNETLKFQNNLGNDKTLHLTTMLGAHNTQSTSHDILAGNLVPNQEYSITDLLDMGVRLLNVDVHTFNRTFRVCHGMKNHLGCNPRSRYWTAWIEELTLWLRKNPNEFVLVTIQNEFDDTFPISDFYQPIKYYLNDLTVGEDDLIKKEFESRSKTDDSMEIKKISQFPSKNELLKKKKQVAFLIQNPLNIDKKLSLVLGQFFIPPAFMAFPEKFNPQTCDFDEYLETYSTQFWRNENQNFWVSFYENRTRLGDLIKKFDKKFKNEDGHEVITDEKLKEITRCNFGGVLLDFVSPTRLYPAVWSWDILEPRKFGAGWDCTIQFGIDGKWKTEVCGNQNRYACVNKNNHNDWKITETKGPWFKGNETCLELGPYQLGTPKNGYQNNLILNLKEKDESVWLSYATSKKSQGQVDNTDYNIIDSNLYRIKSVISQKYVTEFYGGDPRQFNYLGYLPYFNKRQNWIFTKNEDSTYSIKNAQSNNCLTTTSDFDGSFILSFPCKNTPEQKWKIENIDSSNYFIKNSKTDKCIDIFRDKFFDFSMYMAWKCFNVPQHKFILEKVL